MADTPLGRGLIEIGANLAPLEKGLAEAQAKTRAALGGAAVGGGATTAGGAASGATSFDASKSAKEYASEMTRAQGVVSNVANESKKVASNTKEAATQSKFINIGVAATAGAVATLGRALDQLWKGFKGFGDSARALGSELRAIESQFRSDITASLDPLSQRTQEIEKARLAALEQLEVQRQERGIIGDIVGYFSDEAELAVKTQKINEEAAKAQKRNQDKAAADAKKAAEQRVKDEQKGAEEAEKFTRQLYVQTLDERGKLNAEYEDDVKEIEKKRDSALTLGERMRYTQALALREDLFNKELQDLDEKERKQKESDQEIERGKRKAQADFLRAQAEQFASVRQQINSLFNTGSMETSINRVADLVQVLIDKTERR
jgi:hypothetical protein